MKLKKFMKTFVVCFALVALLTVSCFATSAQTTSTTATYGHYISPGEYVFSSSLSISAFPSSGSLFFDVPFRSGSYVYSQIQLYISDSNTFQLIYIPPAVSSVYTSYDGGWVDDSYRHITVTEGFYIYDSTFYQFWVSNVTRVSPGYESNLLDGFLSAFTMIGQWISGATSSLTTMFWANNSLTFLGTLAVAGLAFAVAFLIIGLIQRFLHFRG